MILDAFQSTYSVSTTSGALERLLEIYLWPDVLPDGKHAIYVRWDPKVNRYRAFVLRTSDFTRSVSSSQQIPRLSSPRLYSGEAKVIFFTRAVEPYLPSFSINSSCRS
jgi:hypothetical protein